MREVVPFYVVSNGDQTDTVIKDLNGGPLSLEDALGTRIYEPDDPNFTQRITAVGKIHKFGPFIQMSILRKSQFGDGCDRITYEYRSLPRGLGFCITTYAGDGHPLPAFRGDPLLMPLLGGMENIANTYWDALDTENRVSLAVKWIEIENGRSDIHIINKYEQVKP
jgi:hypothetical protein